MHDQKSTCWWCRATEHDGPTYGRCQGCERRLAGRFIIVEVELVPTTRNEPVRLDRDLVVYPTGRWAAATPRWMRDHLPAIDSEPCVVFVDDETWLALLGDLTPDDGPRPPLVN